MGTWCGPNTKEKKEQLKLRLERLLQLQDEINEFFGDDIVCDAFITIEDRIQYALDGEWPEPLGQDDGFQDFMREINS